MVCKQTTTLVPANVITIRLRCTYCYKKKITGLPISFIRNGYYDTGIKSVAISIETYTTCLDCRYSATGYPFLDRVTFIQTADIEVGYFLFQFRI